MNKNYESPNLYFTDMELEGLVLCASSESGADDFKIDDLTSEDFWY